MKDRRIVAVPLSFGLLAAACGGGGSSPTAANGGPATVTPAPLTIAAVAPSLAQEINTSLAAALRAGLGLAAIRRPQTFLASWLSLLDPTVHAQTGFRANRRSGGSVGISTAFSTPGGGRVVLSNSPISYSNCGYPFNSKTVTASGTLTAQGTRTATDPTTRSRWPARST